MTAIRNSRLGLSLLCSAALASPALASFHFMQVVQIIGGVDGDSTAQAIQLRTRFAGQNLVSFSRVRVFDAAGMNPVLIVNMTTDVPNGAAGANILIASTNFASQTSPAAVPNFTMTNLIPSGYLAAGSLTFEDDGGGVLWRVTWGGAAYTGPQNGAITNDADGNFAPAFSGPLPSSTLQSLRFINGVSAMSTNNAADYSVTAGAATFTNNAGQNFIVAPPAALLGDMNCDGFVTVGDISGFVLALIDPAGYPVVFPTCDINNADVNEDGVVSVGDIGAFVGLLSGA
ncbi:MAG: hypothetical protein SF069_18060 [Phycisphaerae bacterium]|nr:hypothetical protein [Phycisphaerae bacterium]